jgi:hypothetical protein
VLILSLCLGLNFSYSSELFLVLFLPFCLALPLFVSFAGFCGFPSSR